MTTRPPPLKRTERADVPHCAPQSSALTAGRELAEEISAQLV